MDEQGVKLATDERKAGRKRLRRRLVRLALAIVITGALLAAVVYWAGWERTVESLTNIPPRSLVLATGLYLLTYLLRAIRFRMLMTTPPCGLGRMFAVVCMHNMFNKLLPVRTGEASFVVLLNRHARTGLSSATTTLVAARALDIVALFLLFALATPFAASRLSKPLLIAGAGAAVIIASAGFILILHWARRAAGRLPASSKIKRFVTALGQLSLRRQLIPAMVPTLLVWIGLYGVFALLLEAMQARLPSGDALSFGAVVWASTAAVATYVLPISGFGGFGSHELGWTAGYAMLGMDPKLALSAGFSVNLICTIAAVAAGMTAMAAAGGKKQEGRRLKAG